MQLDSKNVYLLLGSNLGDRKSLIEDAVVQIEKTMGTVFSKSSYYETAAWGNEDQPAFFNLALGVNTALSALEVLNLALHIEEELGRVRFEKWGARLIDIDIIFYGDEVIDLGEKLRIPHPEMQRRKFVLTPLAEIAADYIHPVLKKSVSEILVILDDKLPVTRI